MGITNIKDGDAYPIIEITKGHTPAKHRATA